MTQFDKTKYEIVNTLKSLCRHCVACEDHECPVAKVTAEIEAIRGIPIIVNDKLHHVLFT